MSEGRIKHAFPGGNTSLGFFSYYDYGLGQEQARRIIIIKGGPGVGKSTFMKKIAMEMVNRGYDVEFMHCSSDNNSLDGIVIPAAKVAMIDGTAPHVVDPKNPGAVDEIIHLGDFWDEDGMRANKEQILKCNREVGRQFARAYKYIKAAASVYEDTAVIHGWAMDEQKANALADKLITELFGDVAIAEKAGKQRHLFASAITPNGLCNYLDSILTTGRIYKIKGQQGTGIEKLLEKIRTAAVERGYDVESYYCALNPHKLEHIVIPQKDVAFTTSNEYHDAGAAAYSEFDFMDYVDPSTLENYKNILDYNKVTFKALLDKAVETISRAKTLHDLMETYYIPNMDFESVQICWESTLARIIKYAEEE